MAHAALHGRATVVNVSSIATMDPFPNLYAYACAKAALNIGALCVHREGRPLGIRGFAVAPGSVETAMLRSVVSTDVLPTEQTLSPDAVAKVIQPTSVGLRAGADVVRAPQPQDVIHDVRTRPTQEPPHVRVSPVPRVPEPVAADDAPDTLRVVTRVRDPGQHGLRLLRTHAMQQRREQQALVTRVERRRRVERAQRML